MAIFGNRRFTRRGEIEFERQKEVIKVVLLGVLVLAIIVCGITMCATRNKGSDVDTDVVSDTDSEEEIEREKKAFLRSIDTYPRLINADNLLPSDYVPPHLTRLHGIPDGNGEMMELEAATAFTELYNAMLSDGLCIIPLSGYRTYAEQLSIFNYNLQMRVDQGMSVEDAQAATAKYVAVPGSSEHQYGRSMDVTIDGTTNHTFNKTEQGKWLIAHAHEYGFVIRYPGDKVAITGIAYEPWHLRYVGLQHAAFMHDNKICLEEYIELIKKYNRRAVPEE